MAARRLDGPALYRVRAVSTRAWRIAWGLLLAVAVLPAVLQPSEAGFLVDAPVYAVTWGIPLWVALLALWSINRYGDIAITPTTLAVGIHRVPLADLDPAGVREVPRRPPGVADRLTTSLEQVQVPHTPLDTVSRPGRRVRILGGAWGTPAGMDAVELPLRDGTAVLVAVRDRAALLDALGSALA